MGFWQNIFYNKSIRRLREMLQAVRTRDFSLQYSLKKLHGEERRIAEEINSVIREFREREHRREGEVHFYDAILSKVDCIMFATDNTGRVRYMNNAAIEGLCGFKFNDIEELRALHASLPAQLKGLSKGRSTLLTFTARGGEEREYAAVASRMFVSGIEYRLYTLQSVATILKQSEIMAQQRLIRVLTHEIMNSLTPIISLADTLQENNEKGEITGEDMNIALSAISRRADGLLQFVQRYRRLQGIAAPQIAPTRWGDLLHTIKEIATTLPHNASKVTFTGECDDVTIRIDRSQIEQVLINLLKNSAESSATQIKIVSRLSNDERWLTVAVEDNGCGLSPEVSDNVFTPFFTTKQHGEGIGLAVCRQIVCNHGGFIGAETTSGGQGARFTLRLPLRE